MNTKYGTFSDSQLDEYKIALHKKLFWMLLYKDPETKDKYDHVDFSLYYDGLMRKIDGMNSILSYPEPIVEIMCTLEAAYKETLKEVFNYKVYRRLLLDAQSMVDRIGVQHD